MLDGSSPSYDSDSEVSYISQDDQDTYKAEITLEKLEEIFSQNFS
jgi:hypothetical protein